MLQKRACDLTPEDRAEIIRQSDFGRHLNDDLLTRLAANSLATDYRRRRFIYRSGDPADALYVIARGRVKLCRVEAATGREAVIDILSAGSLFGESALYAVGSREKCAVAYENSRLLRIAVGDFQGGTAENRELYDYTFRLIGQRLARAERMVADFALDAIPARLEKLLLEFSRRYGINETNGVLIDIPLPHREIASIVGSTRESVTVRLNAMRRDGIIDFVNRKILIKRPESLAAA
ncbi:MAG: family transcriptional regulator, cyclic receptor protein [Acidobacteriota bacterium]|jgi:CRP/FNR family transcriptional regulator|nr:family transcriptional regulator, cyclic receptor protein [Acidobacteriota bacterium]